MSRISLLILAAQLCPPVVLSGQSIAGSVREAQGRAPVEGAFVSLIGASGARVDAALTPSEGTFFLRAPRSGSYHLRIERIGYADWSSEVYALDGGERRTVEILLPREPVALAAIRVTVSRACVTNPAQAGALADVWSEARKALELAVWAEGVEALRFDLDEYERILDRSSLAVREVTNNHRERVRLPPFEGPTPADLAEAGFARFDGDTVTYYAPDATALLSQEFHDTHCFGLQRQDEDGERLIAVTFEPRPGRAVPDIEGEMWVSEETAELRRVDFRYVGVPLPRGTDRRRLEGEVVFDRLPGGPFYVTEWWLRLPVVGRYYVDLPGADRSRTVLEAYMEAGGAVTAAYVRGERVVGEPTGVLAAVVRDSVTGEPIAGAEVTLHAALPSDSIGGEAERGGARGPGADPGPTEAGRPGDEVGSGSRRLAAITDAAGRFEIGGLPDGELVALIGRPSWRHLGLPPVERRVTIENGRGAPSELFGRSEDDAHSRICPQSALHRGEGAVVGFARDAATGDALPGLPIQARWVVQRISGPPGGTVVVTDVPRYVQATTDDTGLFVLCGLPGTQELVVKAADRELGEAVTIDRRIVWQDLSISSRPRASSRSPRGSTLTSPDRK